MRCVLCAPPTWHARKHTHTLLHACPWFALIRSVPTVSTFAPQPISFGVVVHEIYSDGDTPYGSWTLKQVISRVNKGQRLQKPEGMPITIYLLLQTCWAPLPQDRPSFSEIYAKLDPTSTKQRKADTVVARRSAQSEMEVELEDFTRESEASIATALVSAATACATVSAPVQKVSKRANHTLKNNHPPAQAESSLKATTTPMAPTARKPEPHELPGTPLQGMQRPHKSGTSPGRLENFSIRRAATLPSNFSSSSGHVSFLAAATVVQVAEPSELKNQGPASNVSAEPNQSGSSYLNKSGAS